MVIKRIRIDDFENIPHFESSFDSRLAVLPPPGIEYTVLKAIGIILKSDLLAGYKIYASEKTLIQAEIQNVGKITLDKLNQAIDTIVRTFDENETEMICPYISKRFGIAEWIVQYDIKQRYGKMKKA